jgi:hypothetical protein
MTTTVAKTLLILCSVLILVILNNSMLSPIMLIAKQARAVTTTSPSSFRSYSNITTITNIQLPDILPNNNPSSLPASSSSSGSSIITNANPSTNNHQSSATTSASPPLAHRNTRARAAIGGPTLNDPNLKAEQIINTGLKSTTSMAFLGPNDILVLEKDTGIVHRILNGKNTSRTCT